jgi:hypothetical protein
MYSLETEFIEVLKDIRESMKVPRPVSVLEHCAVATLYRVKMAYNFERFDSCWFETDENSKPLTISARSARDLVAFEYLLPLLKWGAERTHGVDGPKILLLLGDTARTEFSDIRFELDGWIVAGFTRGKHHLASADLYLRPSLVSVCDSAAWCEEVALQEVQGVREDLELEDYDCLVAAARSFSDDDAWLDLHHHFRDEDIVMPWSLAWEPSHEVRSKDLLAFFAGGTEGKTCVRSLLHRHYGAASQAYLQGTGPAPPILVAESVVGDRYRSLRDRSFFCLSPDGQASMSIRTYELISTGCVPVIISRHFTPAFLRAGVPWRQFAIFLRPEEALPPVLELTLREAVSEGLHERMQAELERFGPSLDKRRMEFWDRFYKEVQAVVGEVRE